MDHQVELGTTPIEFNLNNGNSKTAVLQDSNNRSSFWNNYFSSSLHFDDKEFFKVPKIDLLGNLSPNFTI
jgi:hypothetical protein